LNVRDIFRFASSLEQPQNGSICIVIIFVQGNGGVDALIRQIDDPGREIEDLLFDRLPP
jgi:hypothetical protein